MQLESMWTAGLFAGVLFTSIATVIVISFCAYKSSREQRIIGAVLVSLFLFLGVGFIYKGIHQRNVGASQLAPIGLSQGAQAVQKLLGGKEISQDYFLLLDTSTLTSIAEFELKLSPDVLAKFRDQRRWTIRFNTNDLVTATNR